VTDGTAATAAPARLGHTAGPMPPRLHIDTPLSAGFLLALPPHAARHVQVLRLQPGAPLTLFDGQAGEWSAEVVEMGRKTVTAQVTAHRAVERELATPVTLALGMPANERMDGLVEKATELGVAAVQPLVCERSVLRVAGERAERKAAHWQAIAVAACEQSGRNRVPTIALATPFRDWLAAQAASPVPTIRLVLSLDADARGLLDTLADTAADPRAGQAGDVPTRRPVLVLSGPEGGLSPAELSAARAAGFRPVTLGTRVLRADTAPLALLAIVAALENRA
jgi:16S rRNA (uracil1498-N3)-methyltransferase